MENETKFLADSMLGKLARWLIMLGYDTAYGGSDGRPDSALQEQALREGRVFLTRDTRIPEIAGLRMVLVRQDRFEEQLRFVLKALGLKPDRKRLFTRCTYCNLALETVPREEALAAGRALRIQSGCRGGRPCGRAGRPASWSGRCVCGPRLPPPRAP